MCIVKLKYWCQILIIKYNWLVNNLFQVIVGPIVQEIIKYFIYFVRGLQELEK